MSSYNPVRNICGVPTAVARPTEPTYRLSGYNLGETGKAVRFQCFKINGAPAFEEDSKTEWFPMSQVKSMTKVPASRRVEGDSNGEMDELVVKEWILKAKEWI